MHTWQCLAPPPRAMGCVTCDVAPQLGVCILNHDETILAYARCLCCASATKLWASRAHSLSTHCRRVLRSPLVHGRPSLCRCVLSITSADLEAVLYRVEGMPSMAW